MPTRPVVSRELVERSSLASNMEWRPDRGEIMLIRPRRMVQLTPMEAAVFDVLWVRRGQCVHPERLATLVYGDGILTISMYPPRDLIKWHIARIRQKLAGVLPDGREGARRVISTRRGFGYMMEMHP